MRIRLLEGEHFVAIGDARLGPLLNDSYAVDRAHGKIHSLPDLVSIKQVSDQSIFRVREVKFKLEARLVAKALRQLRNGVEWVGRRFDEPPIDRVELVIALEGRALKPPERVFLGATLGPDRYELSIDGVLQTVQGAGTTYPVSLLLI